MAKSHKMNRGVTGKSKREGGMDISYPNGVHTVDSMGNIFASFPEISRCVPKYFTIDVLKDAVEDGKLTLIGQEDIQNLENIIIKVSQ